MKFKFKDKSILHLIVGFGVILYAVFGSGFMSDIKQASSDFSEVSGESKKVSKEVKYDNNIELEFINVGQADCILVRNGNHNMLIDAGNNADKDKLVSYFKSLNIKKFDYVFASHAHEDHIGGMSSIIDNFDIDKFYMPDEVSTTKTFEDMLDSLENKNMRYSVPEINTSLTFNDANIKVLHVDKGKSDLNETSIVLKITYGNNSFLLMGDAPYAVEKKILSENIESDVLKVGHHGSNYSTSDEFLNAVSPTYAVISAGKNNIYNHPSKTTIDKLNNKNVKIYRTDIDGTIIFESDGNNISVKTINTDTNG